jgi:hypothetical protein
MARAQSTLARIPEMLRRRATLLHQSDVVVARDPCKRLLHDRPLRPRGCEDPHEANEERPAVQLCPGGAPQAVRRYTRAAVSWNSLALSDAEYPAVRRLNEFQSTV